ncbi:hypothetical protein FB562_2192 [Homoserinimonas aerilata]|uniref:Uncharacterized protein n=1 Tax=Homoserinimonas aerilata TaxID=1162970 RepID=A0A542YF00_9MICO|nr:hypothetical protein [Homoserinimonas aerilata]TQL46668.1 hypothetical protein FB562_2192 [Homoserinimonas aerilata]
MYSVNGIPLDNPTYGWKFRGPSKPISEIIREVLALRVPGRDGVQTLPGTTAPVTLRLMVQTPKANLETLYSLLLSPQPTLSVAAAPSRTVEFEFLSSSYEGYGAGESIIDLTVLIRLNGVYWRSAAEVISPVVTIANPTQFVDVLSGMSAPVDDALIWLGGPFGSRFEITDSSGAWFSCEAAGGNTGGVLFNSSTGQAFQTTAASPWVPLDELTPWVDRSPGPGFRIAPYLIGGNPSTRVGRLRVVTTSQTGITFRTRARGAYVV